MCVVRVLVAASVTRPTLPQLHLCVTYCLLIVNDLLLCV